MIEIKYTKASDLQIENIREQLSGIFVDGFYHWFSFFSKDKSKLKKALEHIFDLEYFYVLSENGKILAMAALTDGKSSCIHFEKKPLKQHLGLLKGWLAYLFLKPMMENHQYPFALEEGTGSLEFLVTHPDYKRKGIAESLLTAMVGQSIHFNSFVLEVADSNYSAIKLYKKIGFKEFFRKPEKNSKRAGFKYYLYFRWNRN